MIDLVFSCHVCYTQANAFIKIPMGLLPDT